MASRLAGVIRHPLSPPDRPPSRSTASWPGAVSRRLALGLAFLLALAWAVPTEAREIKSEPGISYDHDTVEKEPWSIHIIKVDRSRKDLGFFAPHARGKVLGVSLLADQARSIPPEIGRAIA